MKEKKKELKIISNGTDIDRLGIGDLVSFLKFGEMLYHGRFDGLYVFWGRNKDDKESIRELWFKREQLVPWKGEIGHKSGFIEEMYYNIIENKKPFYKERNKSLIEAGL